MIDLTADDVITSSNIIKNLIATHDTSDMQEAKDYYKRVTGENNFLRKLIRQKVNYLLAKPLTLDQEVKIELDFLTELGRQASIQGVAWLHPYIDKNGKLNTRVIEGLEVIPIYDTEFQKDIVQLIRYYAIEVVENERVTTRYRVEIWDTEKVTYYQENAEGNYLFELGVLNPQYHFQMDYKVLDQVVKTEFVGWGVVPFFPLYNNEEKMSDFEDIKPLVKSYNSTLKGFDDNIEGLQDSLLLIKDKSYTKYSELMELIKQYRILPVDDTGDARYLTLDIPVEARDKMLSILKENIYEFGMGVDTRKLAEGNNLTNVVLKARYADLDLKANEFSVEIIKCLRQLFYIYNPNLKVKIEFNKTVIFNETEQIDNVVKSKGIISNETLIINHPWVKDVKKELEQIDNDIREYSEIGQQEEVNNNIDEGS
ncbi:MAG: phage portal protein [Cetobacterium sp.]